MKKAYFLNTSTGKLHVTEYTTKVCTSQTLQEHIKWFDTIDEAKSNCDKRVSECGICFYRQSKNIK